MGISKEREREFLLRLAPVWLACRWKVMGHRLSGWPHGSDDLAYDLLGCHDYAAEMALLVREAGGRVAGSSFSSAAISSRTISR